MFDGRVTLSADESIVSEPANFSLEPKFDKSDFFRVHLYYKSTQFFYKV